MVEQCTVNKQGIFHDFGFISMDNVDVSLIFVVKMLAFKYFLNQFERCLSCREIYKTIFSLGGEMEIFLVITIYLDPHYLPIVQCDPLDQQANRRSIILSPGSLFIPRATGGNRRPRAVQQSPSNRNPPECTTMVGTTVPGHFI